MNSTLHPKEPSPEGILQSETRIPAQYASQAIDPSSTENANPSKRLTRSQSGTLVKRKAWDDKSQTSHGETSLPRKRTKRGLAAASMPNPIHELPPSSNDMSTGDPLLDATKSPSDSSPSASVIRAVKGQRATLPVPVPNLTKKSRGRRVPTLDSQEGPNDEENEAARTYVCEVDGCGKCFHRGEHLKRHIRSIHTHEKPFKCEHPDCPKMFNRHDNLLQHLKVHKDISKPSTISKDEPDFFNGRHNSRESSAESCSESSSLISRSTPKAPSTSSTSSIHTSYPHTVSYPSAVSHHSVPQGPSIAEQAAAQAAMYMYTPYFNPGLIAALYSNSVRFPGIMNGGGGGGGGGGFPQSVHPHSMGGHSMSMMGERAYPQDMAVSSVRTEMPSHQGPSSGH